MGNCFFKEKKYNTNINEYDYIENEGENTNLNSISSKDKCIYTIQGTLCKEKQFKKMINFKHINIITTINFYEDYLIIYNDKYTEKISYYHIKSWALNKMNNLWRFYKVEDNDFLIPYDFYINESYNKNDDVCHKLLIIIKDHLNHINTL